MIQTAQLEMMVAGDSGGEIPHPLEGSAASGDLRRVRNDKDEGVIAMA